MSNRTLLIVLLIALAGLFLLGGGGAVLFYSIILRPQLEKAKEDTAKGRLKVIESAIERYYINHDDYPANVAELTQPDAANDGNPYLSPDDILDPWQNPYRIEPLNDDGRVHVFTTTPGGKIIRNTE